MKRSITCLLLALSFSFLSISCSTESTPVYQLTTNSEPSEAGTVSPSNAEAEEGKSIQVTATPHENWIFDKWGGDHTGSQNPVDVTMNQDKNVTAIFVKREYPLTITIEGNGSVDERIVQEKTTEYEAGTTVELTAQPSDGWRFDRFDGDIIGEDNPQNITVDGPKEVTAIFEEQSVASIEITPESTHMLRENSQQFSVSTYDETGFELEQREIVWSSSNEQLASVNAEGIVSAHETGAVTISAESEGIEQSAEIRVERIIHEKRGLGCQNGCAFTESGELYCWGHNVYGEVGDGTTEQRDRPVLVEGGHQFKTVSVGCGFTTALTEDGTMYGWGNNNYGQLGTGDNERRTTPTRIDSNLKFTQVSVGVENTLGLTADGTAYAWGRGIQGRIGNGSKEDQYRPVQVAGGIQFSYLSFGGRMSVGLDMEGRAYSWGSNDSYALGQGNEDPFHNQLVPAKVAGDIRFVTISADEGRVVGLTKEGKAYGWGQNFYGKLGDGTDTNRNEPVPIAEGLTFKMLVGGGDQTHGITLEGELYGWGYNGMFESLGTLGVGITHTSTHDPLPVIGNHQFKHIYMGGHSKMGITENGEFYMWGWNGSAQLGLGDTDIRTEPVLLPDGNKFIPHSH